MNLQDSVKYLDSALTAQKGLVSICDSSLLAKDNLIVSLGKQIKAQGPVSEGSCWETFFSFLHDLQELMISREIFVFVVACTIMGFVIITVDWLTFLAGGNDDTKLSLLSKKYSGWKSILRNYAIWGLGAGVLAYVVCAFGMFQCSIISCVVIAILWPTLFPKIIEKAKSGQGASGNEPVQQ